MLFACVKPPSHSIVARLKRSILDQVLGGKKRDRIKTCCGGINSESVEKARIDAREAVENGYAGLKGNPLESRTWPLDYRSLEHSTEIVAAVREEVGPDVELMLDCHGSPNPALSVAFAQMAAPYRPLFLEEPVKVGSVDALREVSARSPIPVATGEKLFEVRDFKQIIDARACSILQPDMSHAFGMTTFLHISRLAEQAQILMAPHMAGGPVFFAAMLHADAVISNFLIQEANGRWLRRYADYAEHDFEIRGDCVRLGDRPGLGIEVKEDVISRLGSDRRMAYRHYRHEDGS